MRALLDHAPVLEEHHAVRARGLAEAVRDDERRAAGEHAVGRGLEHARAGAARLGGRLVEHGDRRVGEREPRQRELLGLGRRERDAADADHRVAPVGQRAHPGERTDELQRRVELRVARAGRGEAQVGGERAREHVQLLRDERDGPARRGRRRAADRDAARRRRVEAGEDLGERRLARARPPDERDALARGQLEVDAVQDVVAGRVGVPDPSERDGRRAAPARAAPPPPRRRSGDGIVATPTSRASAASARWASSTVPSTMLNWSNRRTNSSAPAVAPPTDSTSARTSRKPAASTAAVPASSPQFSRV